MNNDNDNIFNNKVARFLGHAVFVCVVACILACVIALTVKFITWVL